MSRRNVLRSSAHFCISIFLVSGIVASAAGQGAPREGDRFVNPAGTLPRGGIGDIVRFFGGKIWGQFSTRSGAPRVVSYDPEKLSHNPSITWIGHATMLVRMDGMTFLTDPMFSERASPLSFAGPKRLVPPGIPLDQLPKVDFVTLSHDHYDHTDLPSIEALARKGAAFIVPLGMGELVRDAGGTAVELDWWQSAVIGNVEVHCVPAQHFSGRGVTDHSTRLWAGWVVAGPSRRFYHAGDTGYSDGFKEIGSRLGPIDLASVPIGAYDPAEIMHAVHVNPEEAVQAATEVRARKVIGMHYGTFDLTDEPLDEPPQRFRAAAARSGFATEDVLIFDIGETRNW